MPSADSTWKSRTRRRRIGSPTDTKAETVNRRAAELLANGKITARLADLRASLRKRHNITMDDLVEALRPVVFSDIRKVVSWGDAVPVKHPETGQVTIAQGLCVKSSAELDDAAAASIAEVVQTRDGIRVKLHDKLAGIEKLGKLLGLIKDLYEHTGKGGGPMQFQSLDPKRMSDEELDELDEFIRRGMEVLTQGRKNGAAHR
jgi:phage terminase small subunit